MGDSREPDEAPPGWTAADVDALLKLAGAAWPSLIPPEPAFAAHVDGLLADGETPRDALTQLRIGDLYLAYLCARSDLAAIEVFEQQFAGAIATSVHRIDSAEHSVDDLHQLVRARLFVGDNAAVKSYSGRGALAAWVGVVALRTSLNAVRSKSRTAMLATEDLEPGLDDLVDPELDYLRQKYRADFQSAFAQAVTGLTSRERTLLRQHLVQKLTVRELGRIYSVNSGTVSRWIVRAREGLASRTCDALRAELDVTPEELDSIMELIRSRVDLSLTRVLAATKQSGL